MAIDLLELCKNSETFDVENTKFGVKYKVVGEIAKEGFYPGKVLTVWIVESGMFPRLVTAVPYS